MWTVSFIASVNEVPAPQWNRIVGSDYPFLRHEFLLALERSGATGADTGWEVCHAVLWRAGEAVGFMPLYLKTHGYGEYVFDHAWANAYYRHGLDYYPKLVSAIPFTPVTGPRLCLLPDADQPTARSLLTVAIIEQLERVGGSSWHVLFPERSGAEDLESRGLLTRHGVQFHWHNRGYRDFADFLDGFNSRKRKAVRRERARVREQGLSLALYEGREVSARHWDEFFLFYQMTYAKRSGHGGYLNREFFDRIGDTMADQVVLVLAEYAGRPVAGALSFRDGRSLYGRYWGCSREFEHLHFETCYYRGIEYCIEHGLSRFDSGAQGEHKIQRGFEPSYTLSSHYVAHPGFRRAIADFLREERLQLETYHCQASGLLPFRDVD